MEKSITVARTAERPIDEILKLLGDDAGPVLSRATKAAVSTANEVVVHLGGKWHWFDLDENVEAQVGAIEQHKSMASIPLSWKADHHKRLLPSLTGQLGLYSLSTRHTEVSYTATYTPPLGLFGGLEDFFLGRKILETVLGRLLDEVVGHITESIPEG